MTTARSSAARRSRPSPTEHGLKQVSVADLIAYRQRQETLIERVACSDIDTPGGKAKAYHLHAAVGRDAASRRRLRRHPRRRGRAGPAAFRGCRVATCSAPATGSTTSCGDGRAAARRHRLSARGIGRRRPSRQPQPAGAGDGEGHEEARRRESEWREIGLGAQILKDLGISSINLIASRERHYVGLEGFGIQDRQDGDSLNLGATGVRTRSSQRRPANWRCAMALPGCTGRAAR